MAEELSSMGMAPGALAVSLAECKAFLRLEGDSEDAILAGFIRTAMALCEAFTGQWLIARDGAARLTSDHGWQRLLALPMISVIEVCAGAQPLPRDSYEFDVDSSGVGWLRLSGLPTSDPVTIRFRAGLATDWNGIPEPLRQGMVRLVAHLFSHRDAVDAGPPPAAVAAMWRPWRRMRLG